MPIFFKISFVSQSTQNLFAALRLLNVNPASTAASLLRVTGQLSVTHTAFSAIFCVHFCYIPWQLPVLPDTPWVLEGNPKFKANQGTLFQGKLQNRSHLMQPWESSYLGAGSSGRSQSHEIPEPSRTAAKSFMLVLPGQCLGGFPCSRGFFMHMAHDKIQSHQCSSTAKMTQNPLS